MNPVTVKAFPQYSKLCSGLERKISVLFQILGGTLPESIHQKPMNMAIVLDRSGSMEGSRLENCKLAILQLFEQMTFEDRLHLVVYDDRVDTILENANKGLALEATQQIYDINSRGSTNLLSGVERGVELVQKYIRPETCNVVFLFSDGQVTSGQTNALAIGSRVKTIHKETGICFTSYGIGSDFNESLMTSIARCGKGNSFYIDDLESIPELVKKGYNGFTRLVAQDLRLRVRGLNGSVLTELSGVRDLAEGKQFRVLREKGIYQVLAQVTVGSGSGQMQVLEYELLYTDLATELGKMTIPGTVTIEFVDGFVSSEREHPAVRCYLTMQECGKLNSKVTKYLESNNVIRAIELKKEIISMYESVVEHDELGLIAELLKQERRSLSLLEREGSSQRSLKTLTYSSKSTPGYRATRPDYEDHDDDEDQDMGYVILEH